MSRHTILAEIEVLAFAGMDDGDSAYPVVEIEYGYTPGHRAWTPRGEFAPIDPPEPASVEFISARIDDAAGLAPTQSQVDEWAIRWLARDYGYDQACRRAEEDRS